MRGKFLYTFFCSLFITLFITNISFAQRGDTTQTVPPSKSPFGTMGIPTEMMDIDAGQDASMTNFKKFELRKDYTEEYKKYGLKSPEINLHLDNYYYNPAKELHPAAYALLLVGAFFNNRILTIPEEQYRNIMDNIYGHPTPASRYEMTQYNISKGVFGHPGITVSGYRTATPPANSGTSGSPIIYDGAKK